MCVWDRECGHVFCARGALGARAFLVPVHAGESSTARGAAGWQPRREEGPAVIVGLRLSLVRANLESWSARTATRLSDGAV
jgi:hypothetical protein